MIRALQAILRFLDSFGRQHFLPMEPTTAREAAPRSAKRRRDQQLRAQRRHVGWLVSLLQTGGHHSFKGGVAPRQAMDTATKNDEGADAVEMVRSLKAHVAMLESRLEGLTALLCGVIGKAVEPGAGTVASAGGEPSSAEDKRTEGVDVGMTSAEPQVGSAPTLSPPVVEYEMLSNSWFHKLPGDAKGIIWQLHRAGCPEKHVCQVLDSHGDKKYWPPKGRHQQLLWALHEACG